MPTVSAINIVRQKKEVMRICASHVHLREEKKSSDTQRTHHQRIKPKLKANGDSNNNISYRNTNNNNNSNGNSTGSIDYYTV